MKRCSTKRFVVKLLVVLLSFFGVSNAFGAPGDVDAGFHASVGRLNETNVFSTAIQADGKILVGGAFQDINGSARIGLARLNPDGSLDTSFNPPDILGQTSGYGSVSKIGLLSNGKIIVSGRFSILGQPRGLVRLNTDGSLDSDFVNSPAFENVRKVSDFVIYPDDKILFAGGRYNGVNEPPTFVRVNPDGSVDRQNGYDVFNLALQSDGKIVAYAAPFTLIRYNSDFSVDNTFQTSNLGTLYDLVIQPDGKIVVGGSFNNINGFAVNRLARINSDGTVDTSFNIGTAGPNSPVRVIKLLSNGKFFIGGEFTTFNGAPASYLALLNSDGTLDNSFSSPLIASNFVFDVDVQTDGKILVSCRSSIRLEANGSLDSSYAPRFGGIGIVYETAIQPDGKILVGGYFTLANTKQTINIARFDANGNVDESFNPPSLPNLIIRAIDVQADGKILIGGTASPSFRLNADGSLDNSIIHIGINEVYDIKVLADGKFLLAGNNGIKRYNSDLSSDATFTPPSIGGRIYKMALQTDGKIVIAGSFNASNRSRIARLNADGTLDETFNPTGSANDVVWDVGIQADGKIVIAGDFTGVNFDTTKKYLARLNGDGSLDTGFSPVLTAHLRSVKIQPDGKILTAGYTDVNNSLTPAKIYRFNSNGTADGSFSNSAVANDTVWNLNLQADGKILIGGEFARINGASTLGIARLLNSLAPMRTFFDFDGDVKADISVFRPSENKWYILRSSDLQITQTIFAVAGDVPVPADYDGDGKTDLAVFRPGSGDWWYQSSINGAQVNVHWGQSGDIPRPGDFDGDGKTDFVLYRPSNNAWYRLGSSGATSILAFGTSGDVPLIGDFDGDGKSDPAVFRPGTGDWWYASSISGQFLAVHWGASGDIPVPGDYDGDGKTDFVVFRPTDGGWYILYSTGSYTIATFGTVGDKPIAADYDGDGKTDIAVFRPSTGTWYLLQTTAGFGALQFGVSTDVPTENAFLP